MDGVERIRFEYRRDIRALCDQYLASVNAYLDTCKGKRFKCTTHEHPMDGKVLSGYEGVVRSDSGVTIVGRRYQPMYLDLSWTLKFEDGSLWPYNEDLFGVITFE